jgi:cation diffusion facilitator CzcD-associated flavoprotein CzcO
MDAGFGGIGAAIQLKQLGYDNIVILDREADLGGTWRVTAVPARCRTASVCRTRRRASRRNHRDWRDRCAVDPQLAARVVDLTVYQRTATYVVPKIDFAIPVWLQRLFARLPLVHRAFRVVTDAFVGGVLIVAPHYLGLRRLAVAAADLSKDQPVHLGPRQGAAAQADARRLRL